MRSRLLAAIARADEPVDSASLGVFRAAFGLLMAVALVRLHLTGWTTPLFLEPGFRFEYATFWFVPPIPASCVPWVIGLGACCATLFGFGRGWVGRVAGLGFLGCFVWLKLFDVTNYLNHDYLAVVLAALLLVLPLGPTVPRWVLWLLRAQVAVVYVHAGLAKVNAEWLLEGQPLTLWFAANRGLPVLGPLLSLPKAAIVASWAACLYDTTIVFWLMHRKTRPFAFAAVLVFHGCTHVLFDIGVFPFLMTLAATLFFEPDWPRRFIKRSPLAVPHRTPRWALSVATAWLVFQVAFPLRSLVLSDDVLWDEQGMRWSWKVMLREKNGAITYRVRLKGQPREWQVSPTEVLTPRQANEMSGQPDLILQLARHLGSHYAARFGQPVEIYVDSLISLNGRPPAPLFRADLDLLTVTDDTLPRALMPSPRVSVN